MKNDRRIIGIMGAMPEEIDDAISLLSEKVMHETGMRKYYTGTINDVSVVIVFSRWGKVAAATTATTLINQFKITELIFTGVAGAIDESLNIGDIVIGRKLFQHDMDARPLMEEFEIPLLGNKFFESDADKTKNIHHIIKNKFDVDFEKIIPTSVSERFNIKQPKVIIGDIASGDHFFSSKQSKEKLSKKLPSVVCVEMEGAAVAQVCHEHNIPFCIIRTISDASDEKSEIDFPAFVKMIAGKYSQEIINIIFR